MSQVATRRASAVFSKFMDPLNGNWTAVQAEQAMIYVCGFCGNQVASDKGWHCHFQTRPPIQNCSRVCPFCQRPTYFESGAQIPGVPFGEIVKHLPKEVEALYNEARKASAASAYTAAVLVCRKLLMHKAVHKGADVGQNFLGYVNYLANSGFVPPGGKGWVDHIRKKGNEANHEIILMVQADAQELITFTEMLLKFIYEFPGRFPATPSA